MQTDTYRLPSLPFSFNELFCLGANNGVGRMTRYSVDSERKGESIHITKLSHLRKTKDGRGRMMHVNQTGNDTPLFCCAAVDDKGREKDPMWLFLIHLDRVQE